ncbi:MAG TPA: DinB family protein, partial [Thermoanaerobaculia bacterium]|nr:DinB family protein [Thermoanaerobaculia bacterium]
MHEVERISRQIQQGFEGEAWHGPAVLEILADVDAALAAARPIPGAHSIWELALHLAATQEIILRRIQGERAGLTEEEFWPATPEPTEEAWQATVARLRRQETELRQAVTEFPD